MKENENIVKDKTQDTGQKIPNVQEPSSDGSFKMLRALVGIGVVCALLIVFTFEVSKPRIKQLKQEALEKAIGKVIPGITSSKTFILNTNGTFAPHTGEANGNQLVYAGYDASNQLKGIAIEAAGQGYADIIRVLYGYDPESQSIIGFYVLESKETPGLGDKIEKDPTFLANFEKLEVALETSGDSLKNEIITVKKGMKQHPWEIDGITGATISSRAIGDILNNNTRFMIPLVYKNKESFKNQTE